MTRWKPAVVLLLTALAAVSQFALPAVRPVFVGLFLLICPGAALVGFLRLSAVTEGVLSAALSLVLLTLTAEATVLLGLWPLEAAFWSLVALSLAGASLQAVRSAEPSTDPSAGAAPLAAPDLSPEFPRPSTREPRP